MHGLRHEQPHPDELASVLVVDDHTIFAELLVGALTHVPGIGSVTHARTVRDGLSLFRRDRPSVVVMDLHLPDGDGIDAAERIREDDPSTRVVLLTGNPRPAALHRASQVGVAAFLPKNGSLSSLIEAVKGPQTDTMVVAPSLLAELMRSHNAAETGIGDASFPALTRREYAVLRLMAEGKDARAVAADLNISINTSRSYIKAILSKVGAHSQLEAVVIAGRRGLLPETGT